MNKMNHVYVYFYLIRDYKDFQGQKAYQGVYRSGQHESILANLILDGDLELIALQLNFDYNRTC